MWPMGCNPSVHPPSVKVVPPVESSIGVTFESASPEFDDLHEGTARLFAKSEEPLFHEAGVWIPKTSEWLVTSNRLLPGTPETHIKIIAMHYPSGAVRRLEGLEKRPDVEGVVMANGGTTDFAGGAYLCSQGLGDESGSLWHIDDTLTCATRVGPPNGLIFNSLNDVVQHRNSGMLFFTDPGYGIEVQGFRTTFNPSKAVWAVYPKRCSDTNDWYKLDELADQPNGILLSPNEKVVYTSDVWNGKWHNNPKVRLQNTAGAGGERSCVRAYDVIEGIPPTLSNPRILIDLRQEEGASGYPDGLKCDEHGNLYTGCGGGVRVYSPSGKFLGRFAVEGGIANLCFGGTDGRTLLMLNETKAYTVRMKVAGALV